MACSTHSHHLRATDGYCYCGGATMWVLTPYGYMWMCMACGGYC